MKRIDKFVFLFLAVTVMAVCAIPVGFAAVSVVSRLKKPAISEVTTPLSPDVVRDICHEFEIDEDDWRCRTNATVYAPDFFSLVRSSFQQDISTYDDVQAKLSRYQFNCESLITGASGNKYFICDYDLHGDRTYPIGFFFHADGTVWKIFATVGDD